MFSSLNIAERAYGSHRSFARGKWHRPVYLA